MVKSLQERQLRWEEYQDLARYLLSWLQNATAMMNDRSFPATLIEMKVCYPHFFSFSNPFDIQHLQSSFLFQSLLAEFNRFRIEDVPPRLAKKQKLGHLYDELQVKFSEKNYRMLAMPPPEGNISCMLSYLIEGPHWKCLAHSIGMVCNLRAVNILTCNSLHTTAHQYEECNENGYVTTLTSATWLYWLWWYATRLANIYFSYLSVRLKSVWDKFHISSFFSA